jgi:hypothetical protein
VSGRSLTALGVLNVGVHVVAMALAALGMRPGTAAVPLAERMAWLASYPPGWTVGWALWMLCAVADLAFIAALATRVPSPSPLATLAVTLATTGAAVDLTWDTVHVTVLPLVAGLTPPPVPVFLVIERLAWTVGAVVANGFYSAATLLVTVALRTAGLVPGHVLALAAGTFGFGLLLCAAGFTGSARHLELAAGPTVVVFILWILATLRALRC